MQWGIAVCRGQRSGSLAADDCQACSVRTACTTRTQRGRRLTIREQATFEVLHTARARQHTARFDAQYTLHAGIEGSLSHWQ